MKNSLEFKKPGVEWRGKPFWAWNGKLEKDELINQIHVMKEMGFGGFFMHSRTGLITEYLGDEWFDLINACADEAEKLGMEAWLYDEDRWPSGTAGGMVTAHPEFRQKSIKLETFHSEVFEGHEKYIGVWVCDFIDKTYANLQKVESIHDITPGMDKTVLAFSIEEMGKSNFYNGFTYVDTMNRAATEYYLKVTHEYYAKKCGDRLGKSIKGIFTDEPHRGALLDGFSMYCEDGQWRAPYTYVLFEEFYKRFGYDLMECLPELFLKPAHDKISKVKWDYVELLQELFIENFAIPCQEWCQKHNLILTGHILHEDNLTAQTAMCGSIMRYYKYLDWPGVDVLTEGNRSFWIVKQLQSAARQLGRKWLLSELYGCTGWQMPFKGHKAVGDWQTLFGINLRCHHLSWYSMQGEAKRDYPASIFHQSAWYKEYGYVESYFARFGMMMSQGEPICDVLMINNVESVWSQIYVGWSNNLAVQDRGVKKLEKDYENIFHWLLNAQIDFDYGDEGIIAEDGRVAQASSLKALIKGNDINYDKEPVFCIGEMKYKVVIVAQPTTLRKSTCKLLDEFINGGGKVIFAGDVPEYVDAEKSDLAVTLSDNAEKVSFRREEIVNAVKRSISPVVEVKNSKTGKVIPDIFTQLRKDGDDYIFALLNINRETKIRDIKIIINADYSVEEWNCRNGEVCQLQGTAGENSTELIIDLEAAGEKLLILKKQSDAKCRDEYTKVSEFTIKGPFRYSLEEPNVCVLDFAEWKMDSDKEWSDNTEVLKIDRQLRDRLKIPHRSGEMLQPWFVAKSGCKNKETTSLKFSFNIKKIPGSISLLMEEIDEFSVDVNGKSLALTNYIQDWIDKAFYRIEFPAEYLSIGENDIVLKTTYHPRSNIEAIYLVGDFGVDIKGNNKIITSLPDKIMIGDLTEQKLPFYSGAITYYLNVFDIELKRNEKAILKLSDFSGACAVAEGNGNKRIIAWDPYEADVTDCSDSGKIPLKVILTRRNTFGPLHQNEENVVAYGPNNFITEGDEFTEDYVLYPSGLLKEPKIIIRNIELQIYSAKIKSIKNNIAKEIKALQYFDDGCILMCLQHVIIRVSHIWG